MTHTQIIVDAPPSVNALYRNVRGMGRVKSGVYKTWQQVAGLQFKTAERPFDLPVMVQVMIGPCNQLRDADNFLKPILDLLKAKNWIKDDSLKHVYSVSSVRDFEGTEAGKVRVLVGLVA